jgi:hypothetical protein
MATQTIQSWAVTGETLTMNVYTYDSDTAVDSAAATEATNRDGLYSAAFTDLPADTYIVQLETAGGVVRSFFWVATEAATGRPKPPLALIKRMTNQLQQWTIQQLLTLF